MDAKSVECRRKCPFVLTIAGAKALSRYSCILKAHEVALQMCRTLWMRIQLGKHPEDYNRFPPSPTNLDHRSREKVTFKCFIHFVMDFLAKNRSAGCCSRELGATPKRWYCVHCAHRIICISDSHNTKRHAQGSLKLLLKRSVTACRP